MSFLIGALLVALFQDADAIGSSPTCPPEARPPSPAQIEEGMKNARDRGFLWRATKEGRTSYLYGTIHVGRVEWMFPGPELMRAVRASDVVALELDVLDPALARRLQQGMTLKPEHDLPKALKERLRAQLKAACLPEELLLTMSPEMVATTISVMSARREGFDPSYGIDMIYAGLARGQGKPVASLETPDLQLALLLGQTPAEVVAAVEAVLPDLEKGKASPLVARMARMWANSQLGELENYEQWCECLDTPDEREMMKRLLDERNPGLARNIDALHAEGKEVFAAVGSLHMVGPLGLPSLLRERGYKVERVDFKP
jgi:uncharacterized protein YbaP (TraB family)